MLCLDAAIRISQLPQDSQEILFRFQLDVVFTTVNNCRLELKSQYTLHMPARLPFGMPLRSNNSSWVANICFRKRAEDEKNAAGKANGRIHLCLP
jgi:hypothetical protein